MDGESVKFLKVPEKIDAVIQMKPFEASAFFLGGAELVGPAQDAPEGIYYWLRDGRWLMVEVVEDDV